MTSQERGTGTKRITVHAGGVEKRVAGGEEKRIYIWREEAPRKTRMADGRMGSPLG